jgi:sialidase-1
MHKFKQAMALAAGTASAVAGMVAVSGPASAAYSPAGVCGSGYSVIDQKTIYSNVTATTYLLYNGSNNCVTTILKSSDQGKRAQLCADLQRQSDGKYVYDCGSYAYYAGPRYLYANGTCIKWGGSVGDLGFTSPWEHCG